MNQPRSNLVLYAILAFAGLGYFVEIYDLLLFSKMGGKSDRAMNDRN